MGTAEDAQTVEHLSHEILSPKRDISLRSQHAYYAAPSSGFIKTRWNALTERAQWKYEVQVLSPKWQVWGSIVLHNEAGTLNFLFPHCSCKTQQTFWCWIDVNMTACMHNSCKYINDITIGMSAVIRNWNLHYSVETGCKYNSKQFQCDLCLLLDLGW